MKPPARIDAGSVFGSWTVISDTTPRHVLCRCSCGVEREVLRASLRFGSSTSCGCACKRSRKHGMTGTRVYACWTAMVARCSNELHQNYRRYGGRGIKVCARWVRFENFLADMGEPPLGARLDRRDNNKGYSRCNCRWTTHKNNMRNTSRSKRWIVCGAAFESSTEAAAEFGVSPSTILAWCEGYTRKGRRYAPKPDCRSEMVYP
jgi:hypothetical protein